jgi:hypothetical protein
MKNILFLFFAVLSFSFCSKDSGFIEEEPIIEVQKMANLSVSAILAGSATTEHTGSACEPLGIPDTDIAVFFDKDVAVGTDMSSADYYTKSGTGSAFFHNIKPGKYTVIAKNNMGEAKALRMIEIGTNDVVLEF